MEVAYIDRYDRHCLDKLLDTSTEARLKVEGHIFTLSDGREYEHTGKTLFIVEDEPAP